MTAGIVSIDAKQMVRNSLAAAGHDLVSHQQRQALSEFRHETAPARADYHGLQIEYTAGSLTVPERVQFRYKLEGLDRDWQEWARAARLSTPTSAPANTHSA